MLLLSKTIFWTLYCGLCMLTFCAVQGKDDDCFYIRYGFRVEIGNSQLLQCTKKEQAQIGNEIKDQTTLLFKEQPDVKKQRLHVCDQPTVLKQTASGAYQRVYRPAGNRGGRRSGGGGGQRFGRGGGGGRRWRDWSEKINENEDLNDEDIVYDDDGEEIDDYEDDEGSLRRVLKENNGEDRKDRPDMYTGSGRFVYRGDGNCKLCPYDDWDDRRHLIGAGPDVFGDDAYDEYNYDQDEDEEEEDDEEEDDEEGDEVATFLREMESFLSFKLAKNLANTYQFDPGHCLQSIRKKHYQIKVTLKQSSWTSKYKLYSKLFCKAKKFNKKKTAKSLAAKERWW